jgi:hypothetical protein
MLIGDWDRHADQWRWAAFEPPDSVGKVYRPVPRDRDVAFMHIDGVLPTLGRVFFDPKYQNFGHGYGYLKGLNKNGLALDRRFTASLDRADWVAIADSLRLALTDPVIEDAVRRWPEPVYARSGAETIEKLKARRDALPEAAARYYEILAHTVDVVGSHKHERFEVTRHEDATEVVVYKTSKGGVVRRELYRRTFRHDETDEIRLYGRAGNDQFIVDGTARRGLNVLAVGGSGEDAFTDRSRVTGPGKATHFYDTEAGNTWSTGSEARVFTAGTPLVNTYDLNGFKYDLVRPVAFFGANKDDGLFLGGGVKVTRHGFRKEPYARMHRLMANASAATRAFNVYYRGHYVSAAGAWDFDIEATASSPNTVYNFYGLGNETGDDEGNGAFYEARLTRVEARPRLMRQALPGLTLSFGPTFEYVDVREDPERFVALPGAGISGGTFEAQWYAGVEGGLTLSTLDTPRNPRQGFAWESTARTNLALKSTSTTHTTLASSLRLFLSASHTPQVTLALRVGGAHNAGSFPFYASNTLGGAFNLRGHRRTRYAGRTSFYQNAELRAGLFDFGGYLGYGTFGLLAFLDNGRVWTDGESSRLWHQGYGGGLWVDFFDAFVLSATLGLSADDTAFQLGFGFLF